MKTDESRTKIIATLGPATSNREILKELFLSGLDVCRLNFSHGKHEDHLNLIQLIRGLNDELATNVAILADLQGPKLRIGEIENNSMYVPAGHILTITSEKCIGNLERVYLSYPQFAMDVHPGEFLLVDDGKLKFEVIETNLIDKVLVKMVNGGELSSKKGVNLPNTKVSQPSMTEKDIADAKFALEHDVEWIALSFVRAATDILELKEIIRKSRKHSLVIAKIEKPEALKEIDNIIDVSDGIMVARGDLGVEVDYDMVPLIQKEIVEKCISQSKPVIIATQMMESMITNFRPTRAEATDVANAVLDGADTLMLSGETSVGKYPKLVVESMHKIIQYTEEKAYRFFRGIAPEEFTPSFLEDSICYNACNLAQQSNAKAIITFSYSGYTAFKIASYRPKANVFVFTNNKSLIPKMSLLWGVKAYFYDEYSSIENAIQFTIEKLKTEEYLKMDDIVVHIASLPMHAKGRPNLVKISYVL